MNQFGGGRLGGVALQAGGLVEQNFLNMPPGPVGVLYLIFSMSLKSSGSSFTAVVDTGSSAAAEGTDDLDLLLNTLMTNLTIYADPDSLQGSLTLPQWRTVLGLFNIRDFDGSFTNGFTVPASGGSATAITIAVPIPYSLKNYFADGDAFHQGSNRLRLGEFDYTSGSSLTPSVVLANGTAVVSGYSISVFVQAGGGDENDVGAVWQVKRLLNLPTVYDFDQGERLGMMSTTPAATWAASAVNIGPYELWSPAQFQAQYQADQLYQGSGFDITARCTPILWIARTRRFQDFLASIGSATRIDAVSGVSSVSVYDVKAMSPTPNLMQTLAQRVGSGGAVSSATIAPPSGTAVPAVLAGLSQTRLIPGRIAAQNVKTYSNPATVGAVHAQGIQKQGALAQTLKLFKR